MSLKLLTKYTKGLQAIISKQRKLYVGNKLSGIGHSLRVLVQTYKTVIRHYSSVDDEGDPVKEDPSKAGIEALHGRLARWLISGGLRYGSSFCCFRMIHRVP